MMIATIKQIFSKKSKGIADEQRNVEIALESGAVSNVCSPDKVPKNVPVEPNKSGRNFVGLGGETIVKHGACENQLTTQFGKIGCKWKVDERLRNHRKSIKTLWRYAYKQQNV